MALVATGGDLVRLQVANLRGLAWGLFAGAAYGLFGAYSSTVSGDEHSAFLLASILASCLLIIRWRPLSASFGALALDGLGGDSDARQRAERRGLYHLDARQSPGV